jgi:hypothetical protein
MDAIAAFLARTVAEIVVEVVFRTFLYFIAWPFVKLFTLGKYPAQKWLSGSKEETYISCVGIVILAIAVMAYFGQFGL